MLSIRVGERKGRFAEKYKWIERKLLDYRNSIDIKSISMKPQKKNRMRRGGRLCDHSADQKQPLVG